VALNYIFNVARIEYTLTFVTASVTLCHRRGAWYVINIFTAISYQLFMDILFSVQIMCAEKND
jgi:hypothetical protein